MESEGRWDVSKQGISADLKALGIGRGDHLSIGVSLSKVGLVEGGPDGFIDAVLQVLGDEGTLMANTFNFPWRSRDEARAHPFDISTPCVTGVVPEALRKWPGALRSRHPVDSVACIGKRAEYLVETHGPESKPYLPYNLLANIAGKSLFVGLGDNLVAIRHAAQYDAGLMDAASIKMYAGYYKGGSIKLLHSSDYHACCNALRNLVPPMRSRGLLKEGMVGGAHSILVDTANALKAMTEMLAERPTLTLCSAISCAWCRELERNLKLYDREENTRIFHRSASIRTILHLINARRINGSYCAEMVMSAIRYAHGKMSRKR
ncbi:MAG: AAC(3) family N-acetyltransferase [Methanothrix sp.]|nr:AAC(3) family N-acetyltransferase [Methanothrix sp.]